MNTIVLITVLLLLIIIPRWWLKISKYFWIVEHKKRANYYNRAPVPNAQWIALWLTLVLAITLLWREHIGHKSVIIYLGAITILGTISTIDLFKSIPSWIRLLIQISLFSTIVIYGGISIETVRVAGHDITITPWIGTIVSIVWFGLCTNAINRFDGIQGQASGATSIGSFALWSVISFIVLPSYETLTPETLLQLEITKTIALALGLVSLVYTYIEYKPLGLVRDIGTTIYGFSLSYLALLGGAKVGILIVILSLVIFDAIWVTINRVLILKRNPFKWDYTHLHHRLIANGRNRSEVRWFVWIRSIAMMILMLLQWTSSMNKRIILIMMAALFFGINIYLFWIKKLPTEMKVDFTTEEVEDLKMEI